MDPPFAPGSIVAEKYEVIALAGEGGMGQLYRTRELLLDRPVALKVMYSSLVGDRKSLSRFDREGRLLSKLLHPNIPHFYHFGVWKNLPYIAMEYIEGPTLRDLINGRELDLDRILNLLSGAANALKAVHELGFSHRDLKPDNIVIAEAGTSFERAIVVDFGLASAVRDDSLGKLTQAGILVGSVCYMSPEQCVGGNATPAIDVYSLGCILYECLGNVPPFMSDSTMAIIQMHLESEVSPLPSSQCGPRLWNLVQRCLAKSPDKRPTITQFASELETLFLEPETRTAAAVTTAPKHSNHTRPVLVFSLAIIVLSLAIIVVSGVVVFRHVRTTKPAVHLPPLSPTKQLEKATKMFEAGDRSAAIASVESIAESNPGTTIGYYARLRKCDFLTKLQELDKALQEVTKVLEASKQGTVQPEVLVSTYEILGQLNCSRERVAEAIDNFKQARSLGYANKKRNGRTLLLHGDEYSGMDYYAFHCLISTKNGARTAARYFAEICRQHENVDFAETWLATAYCKIPEAALARSIIIKKLEYSPSSPTWINLWLLLLVAEGKRKQEIALVHQLERALVPQLESARRKKDSTLHLSEWTQRAGESSLRYKLEDLYTSLTATQQIIGDKESALRLSLCSSALAKEPEKAEPIQRLQQENAYFVNATELTKGIPNEKIIDHLYRTLLKRSASKAEQTRLDIVRKEVGVEEVGHRIQVSIEFATLYQRERPVIPEDTDVLIDPKDQRTMDMIIGRLAPE